MNTLLVRTPTELDAMRAAGQAVAQTLQAVRAAAVPGVRLRELDDLAQTMSREAGAVSPFLGYQPSWAPPPLNGVLCLSPNEIVVPASPTGVACARATSPASTAARSSTAGTGTRPSPCTWERRRTTTSGW